MRPYAAAGANTVRIAAKASSSSAGTNRTGIAPSCGYLYERDYGDVWWVWIVTDRIPIGIGIVLLYFGFRVRSFWMGVLFFGSLSLPLLLTIPRRYGLAIAITYLIRKRWPDPKDNFPAGH